jgi:hypothetical protein
VESRVQRAIPQADAQTTGSRQRVRRRREARGKKKSIGLEGIKAKREETIPSRARGIIECLFWFVKKEHGIRKGR